MSTATTYANAPMTNTAPDDRDAIQKQIRELVVPLVAAHEITGAEIVAIRGHNLILHMSIGETKPFKPIDEKHPTIFEIGSITKTFTGLLLADMVLKNEVGIHDPVEKFLPPSAKVPSFEGRKITLEDLATHTSALPRIPDNLKPKNPLNPYADVTEDQIYDCLSRVTLSRSPGEKYEYSNLGMGLLGLALSKRAGSSYEDLIQTRILKPLRMANTTTNVATADKGRLSFPHDADGLVSSYWDIPVISGAGAIKSTINDMAIYLVANMFERPTPLEDIIKFAQRPRHDADLGMKIGLAWHIMKDGSTVWHNGGTGGFRSFIGFDSKRMTGVVVLSNSAGEVVDPIGVNILKMLVNEPMSPIIVKKEIILDSATLKKYVGAYTLAPGFILTVTLENGKLMAHATSQPKLMLHAKSKTEFFYRAVDAQVSFTVDKAGNAVRLVLHQNGRDMTAPKNK